MTDIEKLCKTFCDAGITVYPHPRLRRIMAAGRIYIYDGKGNITAVREA